MVFISPCEKQTEKPTSSAGVINASAAIYFAPILFIFLYFDDRPGRKHELMVIAKCVHIMGSQSFANANHLTHSFEFFGWIQGE